MRWSLIARPANSPQLVLTGEHGVGFAAMQAEEPRALTVGEYLRHASGAIREAGFATPDLDARLLLAEVLGEEPRAVHRGSGTIVEPVAAGRFEGFLARRLAGEPVHRILGRRSFYDHEFQLSPETLEPRPDTEILVEVARPLVADTIARQGTCLLADIGTGTGAIAISLLAMFPEARALAIDLSPGALATAQRNALTAGVAARMVPVAGDYLAAIGGPLDIILSNPPYIPSADIADLDADVRNFDPRLALDGGADGLEAYRAIAASAGNALKRGGSCVLEIGQGQAPAIAAIFADRGLRLEAQTPDLAGIIRVLHFAH
ncbi:peptide chain release factor N(5)-glutamine methyltransferase [Jiella marina]|uniref:peptide chain release factor N(5)-glutamine methyltransferase n=1 Tax=Jiella sp. LLJ827 TaxID=2917712 RepID=UPI002101B65B|nr:peptide chain release factor N(5)-glutamine methyltransferase [Jiella sp. LLJ827]MCQ0989002.1 peptide chain release factor N(5)-glutamine methyltransferase [Jiella sp. LLJ827]